MATDRTLSIDLRRVPAGWLTLALAGALALAGIAHGALTADHMTQSTPIGLGFLAASATQLGLAALVLVRPMRILYVAVIAVTSVLIGLYVANVVVGLPLHGTTSHAPVASAVDHEHATGAGDHHDAASSDPDEAGGHAVHAATTGSPEPVDAIGLGTQAAQLAAIGLALALLRRSATPRTTSWPPTQ